MYLLYYLYFTFSTVFPRRASAAVAAVPCATQTPDDNPDAARNRLITIYD